MEGLLLLLKLSFAIFTVFFSGYNILLFLFKDNLEELELSERYSLSFPIGISLISLEMYALALLGKEWSFSNLAAPWLFLFLVNLIWIFRSKSNGFIPSGKAPALSLVEKALIAGISLQFIYVVLKALALPLEAPDAVAIYAIKAKAFYLKGGIDLEILKNSIFKESHQDYPLLLPFAECWMYKVMGSFNDLLVKIIFPGYFLSTLVIFYNVLKRFVKRRGSLLFTFMLSSVPQFANFGTNGYADILIASYYTASFLYLFLWMKEKKMPYLILSSLMSFSAAWTKNEGWMLLVVNLIILIMFLMREKAKLAKMVLSISIYISPTLLLMSPWLFLKTSLGLENDLITRDALMPMKIIKNIGRVWPILYEYQKHVLGPKRWNIAWLLVVVVFIIKFKSIFKEDRLYITSSIIFGILGYTFIYIITFQHLNWHLSTSASRLILHLLPVSLFWLAISTKAELNDF